MRVQLSLILCVSYVLFLETSAFLNQHDQPKRRELLNPLKEYMGLFREKYFYIDEK